MTRITELYTDNDLIGFYVDGHTNYSIPGRDIVCAAVSTLTINTINSISELSEFEPTVTELDDYMQYTVPHAKDIVLQTLLKAAQIGYRGLAEQYPDNVMVLDEKKSINVV